MHLLRPIKQLPFTKNIVSTAKVSTCSSIFNKETGVKSKLRPNASSGSDASPPSTNQWISIYQFPYIRALVVLNKIKIYQAALTSGGIPLTMLLENADILPMGAANTFAALGVTGTMALCGFSALTMNSVGFVYIDSLKEPNQVRISHIDFWGRRKNTELPASDVVPTGDQRRLPLDLWVNVKTTLDNKQSFKLFHRHGLIQQPQIFTWIFGEC